MIIYIGNMLSKHGKSFSFAEAFIPQLENANYTVKAASNISNPVLRLLHMCFTIIRYQFKSKLIIIDCYSTSAFYYALISATLAKLTGKKYICVLHGGDFPNRLDKSPRLSRYLFAGSVINISPSLYLEHHFNLHGFRVKYIPNFINIENYKFTERKLNYPKILWVRAFHKTYNPALAVEVLAEVKKKHPDAVLCMIGGEIDDTFVKTKELAKYLKVEDSVEYTGRLGKEEWRKKAIDYNIFINTTNYDNQPVSVVETMALGLPIVSTNVGGLKYLIQDNIDGLLVEPDNAKDMANKVCSLFNKPDATKQMVITARNKVEKFNWEVVKKDWFEVLKNALQ